jgi:capsular polysaccharide export protein
MNHPTSFTEMLKHRRTLLLQGPMGPFFAKLAAYLGAHGQEVRKINFNGGDEFFFRGPNAYSFQSQQAGWGNWLQQFILHHKITCVVLFGQHRLVHQPVAAIAKQLGLQVFVFEEGYVRPDYVTLEIGGVNGQSSLPRDRAFYDAFADEDATATAAPTPVHAKFLYMAAYAIAYRLAMMALRWRYRNAVYHRPLGAWAEATRWVRGSVRKAMSRSGDHAILRQLIAPTRSGRWFLMPLQVHNDSQLLSHSNYPNMEAAIDEVMTSFASYADSDHWLVIKHHPMDRAYRDFGSHIKMRAEILGITGRVHYVHDLQLPVLLRHTRGMVTVNSTAGIQALHFQTPVLMLGDSVYAVEGLVRNGLLAEFWRNPGCVDMKLYRRFRSHLIRHTQLNASFCGGAPALGGPADLDPDAQRSTSHHLNIWFALFLRELYARANNTVFGYVWIVAEPALHVAVLLMVFGLHGHSLSGGLPFAPFALLGVLGYRVFRQVVERMMSVMDMYAAVFAYPQVFPIDVLLMRFVYELLVVLALFVLFVAVAAFFYPEAVVFPNPLLAVGSFLALATMSMGLGMMAFVLKQMMPKVAKLVPAFTRDLYFISGVFFSLRTLPAWAEKILWWNPVLQSIEILRQGILQGFSSPSSLGYLSLCALVSISLGSAVYFAFRHRVRGNV